MKIAIVCFNLGWQSGGPRLIFAVARQLGIAGHRVAIYTPEFSGKYYRELWQGLDIRVVPPRISLPLGQPKSFLGWLIHKMRQERVRIDTARRIAAALDQDLDVLNVHDYAYTVPGFYKRRNPGVRVIWTENDPPYMYLPRGNVLRDILSRSYNVLKDRLSRQYFRAIDHAVVLDSYNGEWCAARGIPATIVRLGVDPAFSLPLKDISAKRQAKQVTLFGLGALNRYRRYEDLILAVRLLCDTGYDARAKIIANDQWNEEAYRKSLKDLVRLKGLEEAVQMQFTGVSEEGLREAYRTSDVFVYAMYVPPPRNGFGFSISVFEAMAAGRPVILCRTTTATEVLEDRKTALFVDPMRPEQIVKQVQFLLEHPEAYRAIALAGQELVRQNLTWDRYVREMLAVIENKGDS